MRRFVLPVSLATLTALALFALTLAPNGFAFWDGALAALFTLLFGWTTSWFWISALGTFELWRTRRRDGADRPTLIENAAPLPWTAVLIPIHNEDPESVFARLSAMLESLAPCASADRFEFFVLSDTTRADLWLREEICWAELRRRCPGRSVHYRRRPNKFRKKSGNIGDFCERWGKRYRYLIVLDADSVMEGPTMIELVRRMEREPRLGILQAPSLPALRLSFYARLQQFAASVYGPPVFAGLAAALGGSATFWGHNAILRTAPFMAHCGLPGLSGRPPFGGPILSHDFVEAALIRRAGYDVRLASDLLVGSYEQCPVSIASAAARDRRWCQGNLQHLRLVFSPSFPGTSRVHFAVGILFYLTSALWGPFVVFYASALGAARVADGWHAAAAIALAVLVTLFLFGPKLLGAALVLADPEQRATHGGALRLSQSVLLELAVSTLVGPILMLSHLGALVALVLGSSVDWAAAARDETSSPWRDALRSHGIHSLIGAAIALLAFSAGAALGFWLAPIWAGLLLAVPLGALLASRGAGTGLQRAGLLLSPSETQPPPVLRFLQARPPATAAEASFRERFTRVVEDPWLNTLHLGLLHAVDARSRPRGLVAPLVARAIRDGVQALDEPAAITVLSDAWAMRKLHEHSLVFASATARSLAQLGAPDRARTDGQPNPEISP
jgi:membrane glycosyltransferase